MSLCNLFRLRQNRQFCRQHAALLHQNLRCFPRIGRHKSIYYIVTASRSLQPHACLWVHTLPAIPQNPSVGCVRYARGRSTRLPVPPPPALYSSFFFPSPRATRFSIKKTLLYTGGHLME